MAQDVFSLLEEKKNNNDSMETTVWVTYMELYREELRDLLEQPGIHKVFHIREDEKGNTGETFFLFPFLTHNFCFIMI